MTILNASYTAADALKSCRTMLIFNLGAVRHLAVAPKWVDLFCGLQKSTMHENTKFQQNLSMRCWVIDDSTNVIRLLFMKRI